MGKCITGTIKLMNLQDFAKFDRRQFPHCANGLFVLYWLTTVSMAVVGLIPGSITLCIAAFF